jgi:hypothetical protein
MNGVTLMVLASMLATSARTAPPIPAIETTSPMETNFESPETTTYVELMRATFPEIRCAG